MKDSNVFCAYVSVCKTNNPESASIVDNCSLIDIEEFYLSTL